MRDDARAAGRLGWYGLSGVVGIVTTVWIGLLVVAVIGFPLYALVAWLVSLS